VGGTQSVPLAWIRAALEGRIVVLALESVWALTHSEPRSAWLPAHNATAFGDDILFPDDFRQELTLGGRLKDCRLVVVTLGDSPAPWQADLQGQAKIS
jgi:hypothetical protein